MKSPTEQRGQGTEELEQQIREQVKVDRTAQQKPEVERSSGLTEQQQDEQREREQDIREKLDRAEDKGQPRDGAQLPPNPD